MAMGTAVLWQDWSDVSYDLERWALCCRRRRRRKELGGSAAQHRNCSAVMTARRAKMYMHKYSRRVGDN